VGELLKDPRIKEVRMSKYYGDSINVAIDFYEGTTGTWSLDIWLSTNPEHVAFEKTECLKNVLTPENRDSIMHFKKIMYEQDRLHGGMSVLIYDAVIQYDVKTLEEFERYLERKDKT